MRERLPLPRRIQDAPELHLGLEIYYDAFFDLHTCRPVGMGLGSIPWSVMKDYALTWGLDEDQMVDLFYYVRAMDKAYLDWVAKKEAKPPPAPKPAAGSGRR